MLRNFSLVSSGHYSRPFVGDRFQQSLTWKKQLKHSLHSVRRLRNTSRPMPTQPPNINAAIVATHQWLCGSRLLSFFFYLFSVLCRNNSSAISMLLVSGYLPTAFRLPLCDWLLELGCPISQIGTATSGGLRPLKYVNSPGTCTIVVFLLANCRNSFTLTTQQR